MVASDPRPARRPAPRSDAELRLPADVAYASVLRTTASGLAVRQEFTIEDIEDLRMAISEACALVLPQAEEGSELVSEFFLGSRTITAVVSVSARSPTLAEPDSWAWRVLSALTVDASESVSDGQYAVSMTIRSSVDDAVASWPTAPEAPISDSPGPEAAAGRD